MAEVFASCVLDDIVGKINRKVENKNDFQGGYFDRCWKWVVLKDEANDSKIALQFIFPHGQAASPHSMMTPMDRRSLRFKSLNEGDFDQGHCHELLHSCDIR